MAGVGGDGTTRGKSFSKLRSSLMTGLSSASSLASSATASLATSASSLALGPRGARPSVADEDPARLLDDLGMNDCRQTERDAAIALFQDLCGAAGDGAAAASGSAGVSEEAGGATASAATSTSGGVTIEQFVKEMIKRGNSPQWADAAFRSFDPKRTGFLRRNEFIAAICALKNNRALYEVPAWLRMRRRVVFAYYSRRANDTIDYASYMDLMEDLSNSPDDPALLGINNKLWRRHQQTVAPQPRVPVDTSDYDAESLRKALILTKMQLAQRDEEYELLQLSYLQLEKHACSLKLQIAQAIEEQESYL